MKNSSTSYFSSFCLALLCFLLLSTNVFAQEISPNKFKQLLKSENGILLDVRTPAEYTEEHIEGAVNIDVRSDEFKTKIDSLDKKNNYFLYCKSGKRSAEALNKMKEAGFINLFLLKGGIEAWKEKGNEVVK